MSADAKPEPMNADRINAARIAQPTSGRQASKSLAGASSDPRSIIRTEMTHIRRSLSNIERAMANLSASSKN